MYVKEPEVFRLRFVLWVDLPSNSEYLQKRSHQFML